MGYVYEREKAQLRIKCPEKVGQRLALAKEAALLLGQVENSKECVRSRTSSRFCDRKVRNFPSNDFPCLCEVGS